MIRVVLASALICVLCGCDGPGLTGKQRDEAADIASDVSADRDEVAQLQSRVSELEEEVETLKSDDKVDTANINTLFNKSEWAEGEIDKLYDNDRAIAARTGMTVEQRR